MAAHSIVKRESLSKEERLRYRKDFERVYRVGKRIYLPYITVILAPNSLGLRRIGLSVSRKFGKAVKRNRAKRILREIFRRHKFVFPEGHDVIFIPKRDILSYSQNKILKDLKEALCIYERGRHFIH